MGKTKGRKIFEWFFGNANGSDVAELFLFIGGAAVTAFNSFCVIAFFLAEEWGKGVLFLVILLGCFWQVRKAFFRLLNAQEGERLIRCVYQLVSDHNRGVVCVYILAEGPRWFWVDSPELKKTIEDWVAQERLKGQETAVSS